MAKSGFPIGHAIFQSCLLIISQHQPISLQYSWLSVEQPIRIEWVLYKHHWEFPINKKTIPMLTCPIQPIRAWVSLVLRWRFNCITYTLKPFISVIFICNWSSSRRFQLRDFLTLDDLRLLYDPAELVSMSAADDGGISILIGFI